VSAVVIWANGGYVALSFLAGLLAIPNDVHAAATGDGRVPEDAGEGGRLGRGGFVTVDKILFTIRSIILDSNKKTPPPREPRGGVGVESGELVIASNAPPCRLADCRSLTRSFGSSPVRHSCHNPRKHFVRQLVYNRN